MYDKDLFLEKVKENNIYLGIELGSTRIKAMAIDNRAKIISNGIYEWKSKFENGYWTYDFDLLTKGLQSSFKNLKENIFKDYGYKISNFKAIGISAMMHGLLAFDKNMNLLTPFRTWRNTNTDKASLFLSELYEYNIPHRWSFAHFYEAILNKENFVKDVDYICTLSSYIHYLLTGKKVVGIGDASGIFPVDDSLNYNKDFLKKTNDLDEIKNLGIKLQDILPKVMVAGECAGKLTEKGAKILDIDGDLKASINFCPPEGDAGTGMIATNTIRENTGNISIGTSIFSMIVLDHQLEKYYKEIDLVTTPDGKPVAMVHCNNGTADFDAWLNIFKEFALDLKIDFSEKGGIYSYLFNKALEAVDDECGFTIFNYLSGEPINKVLDGLPMIIREKSNTPSLSKIILANLYSIMASIRIGQDILTEKENIQIKQMSAHGGVFKTKKVMQKIVASALNTNVSIYKSASEGGCWGMACLAMYMDKKDDYKSLDDFLEKFLFANQSKHTELADDKIMKSFDKFLNDYKKYLPIQRFADDNRI